MVVITFDQKTVPRSRCGRLSGLFGPTWTLSRKSLFVLISADLAVTFLDIGDLKLSFGLFGSKLRRTPERKKFLSGSGNHCLAASAGQRGFVAHSGPLSRALFLHGLLLVLSVRLSAIGSEVSGIRVWGLFEPQDLCLFCTGFSSSIYERSRSRRSICWHVIISVNKIQAAGFLRKVSFANLC